MSNFVSYQVELIPENSAVIDAINALLIGGETLKSETLAKTEKKAPAKEKKPTAKMTTPTKKEGVSMPDFKAACKAAKKEHGEDFTMLVMSNAGVECTGKLGTTIGAVDGDDYDDIMASWLAGPQTEAASDDLEDDGLDDDDDLDDEAEVTVEAVKLALKAYSKDTGRAEAKAIMEDNGASALSKVDDCTPAQLAAMMKAMV